MPATQDDIDALNAAIRQGERMVRFADGRAVEYRSVQDLILARNDAAADLARSSGAARAKQVRLYHAGRGY